MQALLKRTEDKAPLQEPRRVTSIPYKGSFFKLRSDFVMPKPRVDVNNQNKDSGVRMFVWASSRYTRFADT